MPAFTVTIASYIGVSKVKGRRRGEKEGRQERGGRGTGAREKEEGRKEKESSEGRKRDWVLMGNYKRER